jgi:hypothetical protein
MQRERRPWTRGEVFLTLIALGGLVFVVVALAGKAVKEGVSATDCAAAAFLISVFASVSIVGIWQHRWTFPRIEP